jgi:chromosome segregation ATPase
MSKLKFNLKIMTRPLGILQRVQNHIQGIFLRRRHLALILERLLLQKQKNDAVRYLNTASELNQKRGWLSADETAEVRNLLDGLLKG